MFYGAFVLSKKGPLAKVWLAAHWDKKLTKAQVFETDVESTVESIISPQVKMALRTSGHLLLGVVRIYSRKHKYLIHDLTETCTKIKLAFRPGIVDLPPENRVDNAEALTLPEIFHNFESAIAEIGNVSVEDQLTINPSRASEITLPDTTITSKNAMFGEFGEFAGGDDEFGGAMEDIEMPRDIQTEPMGSNDTDTTGAIQLGISDSTLPLPGDKDKGLLPELSGGLTNIGTMDDGFGPNDPGMMDIGEIPNVSDLILNQAPDKEPTPMDQGEQPEEQPNVTVGVPDPVPPKQPEEFSLEPLDASAIQKKPKQTRKRKLAIDSQDKEFSGQVIRDNFQAYDDLLQPKCFPPPTKKAMDLKEMASCENLFSNPLGVKSSRLAIQCTRNYKPERPVNTVPASDLTLEEVREPAAEENNTVPSQAADIAPVADHTKDPTMDGLIFDVPEEQPLNPEEEHPEQPGEEERIIPEMPDFENLVEMNEPLQQHTDELPEDFEQRRWTKQTQQVVKALDKGFERRESLSFSALTHKANRKQAASRFFSCLLLAKERVINLEQGEPFSEIRVSKGPRFVSSS